MDAAKSVLLFSSGIRYPSPFARLQLARIISSMEAVSVRKTSRLDRLGRLETADTPGVVLHVGHSTPNQGNGDAEAFIDDYLLQGGGVLVVGGSAAPNVDSKTTIRQAILVHQINEFSRVFDQTADFTIEETLVPAISGISYDVHFAGFDATGNSVPAVWTRYRGKGRMCGIAFGNRSVTLRNPQVRGIIHQALRWMLMT